ncbi:hypothetical protein HMPREF3136_01235 [Neisseria sp. HMSC15C08]|nr:hypothetical protein HMPREF3066_07250 [Neisseria sp. HMSC03D10]OFV44025.1 hypothetical protein HMPREF3136_01235 [Neisseria sp. HMSC15C08]DAT36163.1 MAG TPA: hypothetical protein [Caudoviricetes sp.]
MTFKLLTNKWVLSGLAAILVLVLVASYKQGYKTAYQEQQAVIDKMEKDKSEALRLSAQNYARELEQAREAAKQSEAKAHAVGVALAQKQAAVSRLKTENKKEIENALTQDRQKAGGGCIDGLGSHSLRLYARALGYGN